MNKVPHLLVSCSDNPPKADGTASSFTNNQEPTEFKIGSNQYKNRTSPPLWTQLETDIPNPSAIRESRFISLNENSQHPKLEPEPAKQPNPKLVDLNHGGLWSSNSEISNCRYGNLRPEGNIQPIPSTFFQLINPPNKLSSEIWHHIQISEFLKLQASDILLPHPSNLNIFCLGPRAYENSMDLISYEANRIPFMSQDINLNSWADCLRAWTNPPES